jgi:hypothetical protein
MKEEPMKNPTRSLDPRDLRRIEPREGQLSSFLKQHLEAIEAVLTSRVIDDPLWRSEVSVRLVREALASFREPVTAPQQPQLPGLEHTEDES